MSSEFIKYCGKYSVPFIYVKCIEIQFKGHIKHFQSNTGDAKFAGFVGQSGEKYAFTKLSLTH